MQTRATIQLPFDGMSKTTVEVARMIGETLMERGEERLDIFFPANLGMNQISIHLPDIGVLAILNQNSTLNYKFNYLARNGEIGVTATRSC